MNSCLSFPSNVPKFDSPMGHGREVLYSEDMQHGQVIFDRLTMIIRSDHPSDRRLIRPSSGVARFVPVYCQNKLAEVT